jgi:hypothetical protein
MFCLTYFDSFLCFFSINIEKPKKTSYVDENTSQKHSLTSKQMITSETQIAVNERIKLWNKYNYQKTYNYFLKPCIYQEERFLMLFSKLWQWLLLKTISSFLGGQKSFHMFFKSFCNIFPWITSYTHLNLFYEWIFAC